MLKPPLGELAAHSSTLITLVTTFFFLSNDLLWLAIRFKITTGYTRLFLPRILVYIRYVWALSSYVRPFRSRIYVFLKGHIFA